MTEARCTENSEKLKGYADLIDEYLSDKISVLEFQERYLEMFKQDEVLWNNEEFDVLNGLFTDLDVFYYDYKIRDPEDMDESQLRNRAKIALGRLEQLIT